MKSAMNQDQSFDRLIGQASPPKREPASGACLEADVLAALADGSLSNDERAAAEAHAADCDRCLAVVAAIARTAPPASTSVKPAWLQLRWLVPLTTAAVAVTVWVLIQTPERIPPGPAQQEAANAIEPSAAPAAPSGEASSPARDALKKEKQETAAVPRAQAPDTQARRSAKSDQKKSSEQRSALDRLDRVPPARTAAPPPPASPLPREAAKPLARPEMKDERAKQLASAAAAGVVILSPDIGSRWRIAGPTVERSLDAGRTWHSQATGAAADLLAGSSPSANVCWIVGRAGTVLLTTDGESWRRLESPDIGADLLTVTARDASTATITASNGRTYQTTDAGRTWTLQENPAAPF